MKYPEELIIKEEHPLTFFHKRSGNPNIMLDVASDIKVIFVDKINRDYYIDNDKRYNIISINNNQFKYYPDQTNNFDTYVLNSKNIAVQFSENYKNKADQILSTFKFFE